MFKLMRQKWSTSNAAESQTGVVVLPKKKRFQIESQN